jgi:uncharacterized protein with HEPN domain
MPDPFSETERGLERAEHVRQAIIDIRDLLHGVTIQDVLIDRLRRAAFERFLEIISEASRHIPQEWREEDGPTIPWRDIANLGNVIRHAYMHVELSILWNIYRKDIDGLDGAIERMIARHTPASPDS